MDTLAKGSYKPNHGVELGTSLQPASNFTYKSMDQIDKKLMGEKLDYYHKNPEELYSNDGDNPMWRQIFHNSGDVGEMYLSNIYSLLPEYRKKQIDSKKLTGKVKDEALLDNIYEGQNKVMKVLAPTLAAPVILSSAVAPILGGAALEGSAALLGGIAGAKFGSEVGGNIAEKIAQRNLDKARTPGYFGTYIDPETGEEKSYGIPIESKYGTYNDSKRGYGAGVISYNPGKTKRRARRVGAFVGGAIGGQAGATASAMAAGGVRAGVYNTIGQGRANAGYKGTPAEARPDALPFGTTRPADVKGVSN